MPRRKTLLPKPRSPARDARTAFGYTDGVGRALVCRIRVRPEGGSPDDVAPDQDSRFFRLGARLDRRRRHGPGPPPGRARTIRLLLVVTVLVAVVLRDRQRQRASAAMRPSALFVRRARPVAAIRARLSRILRGAVAAA